MVDGKPTILKSHYRSIAKPTENDSDLGPLALLPGLWKSQGLGWNMIALPFATGPATPFNYRLLLNQYDEELQFNLVDKAVPNRGINGAGTTATESDQFIVTLDYLQKIHQVAAEDFPVSGKAGGANLAIHHEPGLWLHMTNEVTDGFDVARLGTIPHGDSVLAMGTSARTNGVSTIPSVNALPDGVRQDLNSAYLAPYKKFHDNPFKGTVTAPGFPGFDPTNPSNLLTLANQGVDVVRTTTLTVDSLNPTGGIANIPFIVKQANAVSMKSTFWIQEIKDADGSPKLRLQYLQIVMLDFFPRFDGLPGLIGWPHVSINTLEKDVEESKQYMA